MDIARIALPTIQRAQDRPSNIKPMGGGHLQTPVPAEKLSGGGREKGALTQVEEEYFAAAFPDAANEIRQHVVYQKSGTRLPVTIGSVVDRKG